MASFDGPTWTTFIDTGATIVRPTTTTAADFTASTSYSYTIDTTSTNVGAWGVGVEPGFITIEDRLADLEADLEDVIDAQYEPEEKEWNLVNLNEVSNIGDKYYVDVAVKQRKRWYNAGKKSERADLTMVIYESGSKMRTINGRQVAVHQTPKAKKMAAETDGGIIVDGELVAIKDDNGILHFLTEDKEIIGEIVEPMIKAVHEERASKYFDSWKTFQAKLKGSRLPEARDQLKNNQNDMKTYEGRSQKHADMVTKLEAVDYSLMTTETMRRLWEALEANPTIQSLYISCDHNHPNVSALGLHYKEPWPMFSAKVAASIASIKKTNIENKENAVYQKANQDRQIEVYRKTISSLNTEIEKLVANQGVSDEKYRQTFNRLSSVQGFETFLFEETSVTGITKDIIVDYNGYSYHLGSFKVAIGLQQARGWRYDGQNRRVAQGYTLFAKVDKHRDNRTVSGYIHPHVSGGRFCSGNMEQAMRIAASEGDALTMFTIAWKLLSTYNQDSPYRQVIYWPKLGPSK